MGRKLFILFGILLLAFAALMGARRLSPRDEVVFEPASKPALGAPMCPWRDPEHDLTNFFPNATRCELQDRILSGERSELAQRLGRTPTGDENVLHTYRVFCGNQSAGTILTRRVKGNSGAIELVLAVNAVGEVRGVRVQRHREPAAAERLFADPNWVQLFVGRTGQSSWNDVLAFAGSDPDTQTDVRAIVDGARALLVSLEIAEHAPNAAPLAHHSQ